MANIPDFGAGGWSVGDVLPLHNEHCVVCGSQSAASPLVEPIAVRTAEQVGAVVQFDARHQGAPRYAHGGMVAAVLDDACGYVSFLVRRLFVTAHLEVDYRRPVELDVRYDLTARFIGIDGRKVRVAAQLTDGDGVVAEALGLFVTVELDHFRP